MGIFYGDAEGVRILICFEDEFVVVWEHIGKDWKPLFEQKRQTYESRYPVLYYQALCPTSSTHERGDNVELTWTFVHANVFFT